MEGYAKIALRMSTHPDLAIFRRFEAINAQNMLYMQAELVHLEFELHQLAESDAKTDNANRRLYSRDWYTLSHANPADGGDDTQWRLFMTIREKLKEYNEALAQQALISKLQAPRRHDLDTLCSCLDDPALPDYLLGKDSSVWKTANPRTELVSLHPVYEFDHVSL
ncbi:MAG: hypothetical protein M1833_000447 [Piccolia ochrophora]|nr:MAG: hypothetical protein M1833_000447 [Piccolia ochrophora]